MKIAKNKTKAATLAFILILAMTATLITYLPTVKAEDIVTYAYLSVAPNPVGVSQSLAISMWLNEVPPSAGGGGGDRWQGFTVTVTKPSGTSETLGPFPSDPVGSAWASYTPTEVGKYSFQMNFPGQSFPNRTIQISPYMPPTYVPAVTYKASTSQKVEVTVQEQPISTYPDTPLPTGYWQRPINSENGAWYTLAGNWLMANYNGTANRFNPYTKAPDTAHIVWTKPIAFGGIVGGEFGDYSYYEGETYEPQLTPPIIMNGILYYNTPNAPRIGFYAVDLRTGRTLWFQNGSATSLSISGFYVKRWGDLTLGQLYDYESPNQHGIIPYLWGIDSSAIATMPVPVTYHMYDAFTGNLILDIVNASAGTPILAPNGELLVYILNGAASWLLMWNSSKCIPTADTWGTGAWQWRPDNFKVLDWRAGIQWNVTLPSYKEPYAQALSKVTSDVLVATTGSNYYKISYQMEIGYNAKTGQFLWAQNRSMPTDTAFGLMGPVGEGVYTEYQKQTMQWYGYDFSTGNKLWGPTDAYTNAWGMYYGGQGGGSALIAYGKLYATAYDGMIHAYNIKTGKHLWDYSTGSSGFETVYGTYPLSSIGFSIADEKLYACSGEHSPSMPLWRGGGLYATDAENGTALWKITGWFEYPVIADGYLVALNGGDMRLYCFGKGETATTVSASPKVSVNGDSVLLEGTVTDHSPGANATAAIADESMSAWMEYLYMQKTMPTNATGVEVTLDTLDPNGNFVHIGTATSDASGMFSYLWTPEVPGKYTVIASFTGSKSYFGSYAETAIGVTEAPPPTAPPEKIVFPPFETYILYATIVIVIAIAIAVVLILRKK